MLNLFYLDNTVSGWNYLELTKTEPSKKFIQEHFFTVWGKRRATQQPLRNNLFIHPSSATWSHDVTTWRHQRHEEPTDLKANESTVSLRQCASKFGFTRHRVNLQKRPSTMADYRMAHLTRPCIATLAHPKQIPLGHDVHSTKRNSHETKPVYAKKVKRHLPCIQTKLT